jgi:hypothetical protein
MENDVFIKTFTHNINMSRLVKKAKETVMAIGLHFATTFPRSRNFAASMPEPIREVHINERKPRELVIGKSQEQSTTDRIEDYSAWEDWKRTELLYGYYARESVYYHRRPQVMEYLESKPTSHEFTKPPPEEKREFTFHQKRAAFRENINLKAVSKWRKKNRLQVARKYVDGWLNNGPYHSVEKDRLARDFAKRPELLVEFVKDHEKDRIKEISGNKDCESAANELMMVAVDPIYPTQMRHRALEILFNTLSNEEEPGKYARDVLLELNRGMPEMEELIDAAKRIRGASKLALVFGRQIQKDEKLLKNYVDSTLERLEAIQSQEENRMTYRAQLSAEKVII